MDKYFMRQNLFSHPYKKQKNKRSETRTSKATMSNLCIDGFEVSDDEDDGVGEVLLKGKHCGKLVSDVATTATGRVYLRWYLENGHASGSLAQAIQAALKGPEPRLTYEEARDVEVPFGEHKGQTVAQVARTKQGRADLSRIGTWARNKNFAVLPDAIEIVIDKYNQLKTSLTR